MLSDLQRRLIALITALPEAEPFALAGGAALIARGIVDRVTEDLDYFTDETAEAVTGLADAVERVATAQGFKVRALRSGHGFVRFEVRDGQDFCLVDLARDARIRQQERSEVGPVLALEELGADKVLALFARAEARDFVDVRALAGRFGWDRLLALAAEKDAGFDLSYFVDALRAFDRLPPAEFPLDGDEYGELREEVHVWRELLVRRVNNER